MLVEFVEQCDRRFGPKAMQTQGFRKRSPTAQQVSPVIGIEIVQTIDDVHENGPGSWGLLPQIPPLGGLGCMVYVVPQAAGFQRYPLLLDWSATSSKPPRDTLRRGLMRLGKTLKTPLKQTGWARVK